MATHEVIEQRLGEDPEDEDVKVRLEREHTELLEELRALIPGAQVLFGFLLAIRFTSPFTDLNAIQRYVYYATLLSTAVALVLLLAPRSGSGPAATTGSRSRVQRRRCGSWPLRKLSKNDFSKERRLEIAIAAAQSAVEKDSTRLSIVITLARTWRAGEDVQSGVRVLRGAVAGAPEKVDYQETARGFWYEWSVCAGEAGEATLDATLAALSISDSLNPVPISTEHAKLAWAGLGVAFRKLAVEGKHKVFAMGLYATSVLGMRSKPDSKTREYFRRYAREATKMQIGAPSFPEALQWLEDAVHAAAADNMDSDLAPEMSEDTASLTFAALGTLLTT